MNFLSQPVPKAIILVLVAIVALVALSLAPMIQTYYAYNFMDADGFKAWLASQPVAFYQFVLTSFAVMAVVAGYLTYKSRQEAKQETEETCKRIEEDFKGQTEAKEAELHAYAEELKKTMQEELDRYRSTLAEASRIAQEASSATTDQVRRTGDDGIAGIQEAAAKKLAEIKGVQLPSIRESEQERIGRELFNEGVRLYRAGKHDEAIEKWKEVTRVQPDAVIAYRNLGAAYADRVNVVASIAAYQQVVRLKPDDPEAHQLLGLVLGQAGRLDEAINEFRVAIRLDPDLLDAHANLGVALGKKGKIKEAEQELRWVIEKRPKDAETHSNLGNVLSLKGDYGTAIPEYEVAIQLKPRLGEAHAGLARALEKTNDPEGAEREYREAVRLMPKSDKARIALGCHLARMHKEDDAIRELKVATELAPDSGDAWYNLACVLALMKEGSDSVNCLKKAISHDPEFLEKARTDADFNGCRNTPEFIEILGKPPYDKDEGAADATVPPVPTGQK